jgi:hypothetical protein
MAAAPPAPAPLPAACAAATPFRAAEKAYQLHREELTRSSGGAASAAAAGAAPPRRRARGRWRVRPLDLSGVVDCGALAAAEAGGDGSGTAGVRRVRDTACAAPVFALEGRPGFFVVVGALSAEEQARACGMRAAVRMSQSHD